jgi:hypothetical protein
MSARSIQRETYHVFHRIVKAFLHPSQQFAIPTFPTSHLFEGNHLHPFSLEGRRWRRYTSGVY